MSSGQEGVENEISVSALISKLEKVRGIVDNAIPRSKFDRLVPDDRGPGSNVDSLRELERNMAACIENLRANKEGARQDAEHFLGMDLVRAQGKQPNINDPKSDVIAGRWVTEFKQKRRIDSLAMKLEYTAKELDKRAQAKGLTNSERQKLKGLSEQMRKYAQDVHEGKGDRAIRNAMKSLGIEISLEKLFKTEDDPVTKGNHAIQRAEKLLGIKPQDDPGNLSEDSVADAWVIEVMRDQAKGRSNLVQGISDAIAALRSDTKLDSVVREEVRSISKKTVGMDMSMSFAPLPIHERLEIALDALDIKLPLDELLSKPVDQIARTVKAEIVQTATARAKRVVPLIEQLTAAKESLAGYKLSSDYRQEMIMTKMLAEDLESLKTGTHAKKDAIVEKYKGMSAQDIVKFTKEKDGTFDDRIELRKLILETRGLLVSEWMPSHARGSELQRQYQSESSQLFKLARDVMVMPNDPKKFEALKKQYEHPSQEARRLKELKKESMEQPVAPSKETESRTSPRSRVIKPILDKEAIKQLHSDIQSAESTKGTAPVSPKK